MLRKSETDGQMTALSLLRYIEQQNMGIDGLFPIVQMMRQICGGFSVPEFKK